MPDAMRPERHPCTCPRCQQRCGEPVSSRNCGHYDRRRMECVCGHTWEQLDYEPFIGDRFGNRRTWAG